MFNPYYEEQLSSGFLLTIPNSKLGRYKSLQFIYSVTTNIRWYDYSYLRISECRKCKRMFILHRKKEIYLTFKSKVPTNVAKGILCTGCKNDEYGLDDPHCECPLPYAHGKNVLFKNLLRGE